MKLVRKIAAVALTISLAASYISAQEKWPEKIVFSVIPSDGASSTTESITPLIKFVEKMVGINIDLKLVGDYAGVITGMEHKHVDVGYFGPKSYVEAAKRANAQVIAVQVDAKSGLPGYNSIIITKKNSGLKTLEDLKGKKWAFTSSHSTSGTLVPTVMFSKKGIDPQKYFSKVVYSGGHEASVLALIAGKIDAVSTGTIPFSRGVGRLWEREDFNVVWTSELIPGAPIAVRKDLPNSLKMALKGAFLSYNDPEGLKRLKNKGYIKADDAMYNPVRELIELKKTLKNKK